DIHKAPIILTRIPAASPHVEYFSRISEALVSPTAAGEDRLTPFTKGFVRDETRWVAIAKSLHEYKPPPDAVGDPPEPEDDPENTWAYAVLSHLKSIAAKDPIDPGYDEKAKRAYELILTCINILEPIPDQPN